MKFHAHALILGLLLLAPVAAAQTPRAGVTLEDLTWTELRDRISAGATTILVPIGGTEQNGPHMVLGKHNVRVRVLAEKIAAMLGNALVAPVIAYTPESRESHALPRHDRRFRCGVRGGPRIRGAKLPAGRLSRHRVSRRSRQLPEGPASRGGAPQRRMEDDEHPRPCHRRLLCGGRNTVRPGAEGTRLRR